MTDGLQTIAGLWPDKYDGRSWHHQRWCRSINSTSSILHIHPWKNKQKQDGMIIRLPADWFSRAIWHSQNLVIPSASTTTACNGERKCIDSNRRTYNPCIPNRNLCVCVYTSSINIHVHFHWVYTAKIICFDSAYYIRTRYSPKAHIRQAL
jgi:hypothetical protein